MSQVPVVDVISEVLQIARECPMTTAVGAYVRAARQLCNKSRWLVATVTGDTVANQQLYSLGSDPYNEIIGIKALSIEESATETHALTEANSGLWDPEHATDVPDFYTYVPEGQFALYPTPNGIYTLHASLAVQPKRGSNSIDDSLFANWSYALEAGALAYLLDLPRTPWTDKAEAKVQMLLFRGYMNQALSSAQRGYNAGAATTDTLGNPSGALRTRVLPI